VTTAIIGVGHIGSALSQDCLVSLRRSAASMLGWFEMDESRT
jgi:hypothetical protein